MPRTPFAVVSVLEGSLRAAVNALLAGADPYTTLKIATVLISASRLLRAVRRAARCEGLYAWVLSLLVPWLKMLPAVRQQLSKESEKLRHSLEPTMIKDLTAPCVSLPARGETEASVLKLMQTRRELDTRYWSDGRVTGAIYHGGREYMDFIGRVYGMFAFANPLHCSIHPATRQMESEVISMVTKMYNGDPNAGVCGAFTTGGTESILMAMKAYRDYGRSHRRIASPNVVACVTAHAAFDKAAQYFGIELRKARTRSDMQVDVAHVRSLIDSNTVALVGSAPQYAHGTIDDIEALGELAASYGVGLHVDCCLGGFLLPFLAKAGYALPKHFDFRVAGVTSISCDPHKYGFAPKGSSLVLFRTPELRHAMYTFVTQVPRRAAQTPPGSTRPKSPAPTLSPRPLTRRSGRAGSTRRPPSSARGPAAWWRRRGPR